MHRSFTYLLHCVFLSAIFSADILLQNSSCIAAVSSEGRLLIYAIKQVVESQPPHTTGLATPDWLEHIEMQYTVSRIDILIQCKREIQMGG